MTYPTVQCRDCNCCHGIVVTCTLIIKETSNHHLSCRVLSFVTCSCVYWCLSVYAVYKYVPFLYNTKLIFLTVKLL